MDRDRAPAPSVRLERVGAEAQPVLVIDGFAPDPDRLVEEAASAALSPLGAFYPGVRAAVAPRYFEEVGPLVAAAARKVFGHRERLEVNRTLFSLATTAADALSLPQRIPHIDDTADGKLAIVHFLSRDDLGGTAFFRHRSTGYETIDETRHKRYLAALRADFNRHGEPETGYIAGDTAVFARTAEIRPAWNRALIYRSNLLHCAAIADGARLSADPRHGRLTIASFLTAR